MSTNERHEDHRLIQKTAVQKPWAQFWNPTGYAVAQAVQPRMLDTCGFPQAGEPMGKGYRLSGGPTAVATG